MFGWRRFFGGGKVVCRQLLAQMRDAKSTSEPNSIPSCHAFAHRFVPGRQKLHCSSPIYSSVSITHCIVGLRMVLLLYAKRA